MMLKICGITNREDALAAVDAGANALGFNFWPRSPRFILPEAAARIVSELPAGVLRVGVFVDEAEAAVTKIVRAVGLDVAQTHGKSVRPLAARWWMALSSGQADLQEALTTEGIEAFLIDAPSGDMRGGSGQVFDWKLAAGLPGRIILAGGLAPENVQEAIRQARPWGVDACSRLEISPGKKDHERMRAFVRAALSESS
jgi:phosphoribosylanthranilate isomerase